MGHEKRRNMEMKGRNVKNMEKINLHTLHPLPKIGHGAWVEDVRKSKAMNKNTEKVENIGLVSEDRN